ncbi:Ankyrin repeat-containing domain protein [Tylopilus felleus]
MKYAVSSDIMLHVTRELDSHRRLRVLDADLKNEIYTKLYKKADGMFRWVECQLNVLRRCATAIRIRGALDDLPADLNTTYERILLNANKDEHEGKVVRRALDWLVAALEPMQLFQIVEGLSIDLGRRTLDRESGPVHGTTLLDILGSLVMYDEATDIVMLSHFSVKEYLTGQPTCINQSMYHINQQDAHERLALLCMCYVSIYLQQSGGHKVSHPDAYSPRIPQYAQGTTMSHRARCHKLPSEPHPLLDYVISHGFQHLAHVNPRKKSILRAIRTLQSDAQQHPSEWEQFCERTYPCHPPWPTLEHDVMLYILVAFAPEPLLRSFIGRARLKPKDGTSPLIYAADFRKIEHARTLLSTGVSVNCRGWNVYGRYQALPIQIVVPHGTFDFPMLDLFLDEGSAVPHEVFIHVFQQHCYIPTHIVSRLLQTDEFVEWAADVQDQELLLLALDFTRYRNGSPSEQEVGVIERRLVQMGCDPSARLNETSFRQAVSAGHVSTVQNILSQSISLPPDIILDASCSNTETICLLLSKGCNVNVSSPTGDTPLHLVMTCPEDDCLESVQVLIDAGCDPSACNLVGKTPLHLAVHRGYISVVECLLTKHSHFLSLDLPLPPDILLSVAGCQSSKATPMVKRLIDNGADIRASCPNGDTLLHLSIWHFPEAESLRRIRLLINAGCHPCVSNLAGETPFHVAANRRNMSVMKYLLTLGISVPSNIILTQFRWDYSSNLSRLCSTIRFLCEKGADIHTLAENGNNLLHSIGTVDDEHQSLDLAKFLVGAGCNPRALNSALETPLHSAARKGHIGVVDYLLSLDIPLPPDILLAATSSSPYCPIKSHMIRYLIDKGANISVVTADGDSPLHLLLAVRDEEYVRLECVRILVEAGCDPRSRNKGGQTPLHNAASCGFVIILKHFLSQGLPLPHDILRASAPKTIRLLLSRGMASISISGDNELMHRALNSGWDEEDCLECTRILIDAGYKPSLRNASGETPMHIAARSGQLSVMKYLLSQNSVKILLDAGCDAHSRNIRGETPVHLAARFGFISILEDKHTASP